MKVADWRKLYKFKYCNGSIIITEYLGNEECIEIPEMIGTKYVTGIAKRAFKSINMSEKNVKKIIVPGTVHLIETEAFYLIKNVEVEIREGVIQIDTDAFFASEDVLIKLPQSIIEIGEQFGDSIVETIKLIVPKGSYVEQFCKENNYQYSSVDSVKEMKGTKRESNILNKMIKVISVERNEEKVTEHSEQIVKAEKIVSIDFSSSIFAISGLSYDEECELKSEIEQRNGTIKDGVSGKVHYLIIPDYDIVNNSKVRKAIELQEKGKPITIIKLAECRRSMRLYDEKVFGPEGAKIAAQYKLSLVNDEVILEKYIGNDINIIIPENIGDYPVVALGKECFKEGYKTAQKSEIKSVVVPGCIKELPQQLFSNCQKLTNVLLSKGISVIGNFSFENCKSLVEITIPDTVTKIEKGAFTYCENLKKIYIPAKVTSINAPFNACNNLTEIVVNEENQFYDSRENCNAIIERATNMIIAGCKTSIIPKSVTKIGNHAFCGLESLVDFEVPEGITELCSSAFFCCSNLKTIKLPKSLVKIEADVFGFCRELKKIQLPLNIEEIHMSAFGNCQNLTELYVNDKLHEVKGMDRTWQYHLKIKTVYGSKRSIARSIADVCDGEYVEIKD